LIALAGFLTPAHAQLPPDLQAQMILVSARKAYTEKNYPFAADRFREFLQKFGGHPKAADARYGLALTLLEQPERNYAQAAEQLQQLTGNTAFPDHPFVLYYLGLSKRALGLGELAQATAKPNEAAQRRQNANQRFGEAAQQFTAAASLFKQRIKPDPNAKELPPDQEWLARCWCDQAEMELRLQKIKEAQKTTEPFAKDPLWAKSRYGRLGTYYHGYAEFLLGDFAGAARSLNRQETFADAVFGTHARYLMGRIHQRDGELAEAAAQYEAVLADYAKQKAAAVEALKRVEQFRGNPEEKFRLEALVKAPPDHVAGAWFAAATLHYEAGRFGESMARFAEFAKQFPDSPRLPEAQLHIGFCQVQLKQAAEAIQTLSPLAQKQPALADQALHWLGTAQALHFDPNNPQAKTNALNTAMATLKQAAERATQLSAADPEAKTRRAEILLELADTQQSAGQHKEAAGLYEQLLNEKMLPQRAEELTQRLASAWHLAGDYPRSDQVCERFLKDFPQSPLRGAVAFCRAENAWFAALAAEKNPNYPNRPTELPKLFDEAAKRFQVVIEKYPEFERVNVARYSLGLTYHRKGEFDKAEQTFDSIAAPDRVGDLALTSYLLADCLMRLAPAKVGDDAIAAGKLQEQLQAAAQLLESFAGANPQSPEAPDALLKLGHCQQRLATVLANPQEKAAALQAARQAYEKLLAQYGKDTRVPQAVFERAKCIAQAGDRGGAMNELRKFSQAPLQDAPIAPLALLRLAVLHREQNQAAEAVKVLDACRKKYENALNGDKERSGWVALLRYHHGVALLESNKPGEARGMFEQVVQQSAEKPLAAEAALRAGQCRVLEGGQKVDEARKKLAAAKPDERTAAQKGLDDGFNAVREAGRYLESQAEAFKQALPAAEPRARMFYDAAWAYRFVAESEVAAARDKARQELEKKLVEEAQKKGLVGAKRAPAEAARQEIPLQPGENLARNAYKNLIAAFAELPLTGEARFELADMFAERGEHDPAIALLKEALDKEPPQELTDRIRLRLGSCLLEKKDAKAALAQFDAIADAKSPSFAQAQYRSAECLIDLGDFAKAAGKLTPFRDKQEFQNIAGLTDRALLRLGFALARQEQWEPSRQAYETLVQRFGNSPWVHEARYGVGWARQKQKQFDDAVNWYNQVVNATATELGAKAQLQIGVCRMEQKRFNEATSAFMIVATTYNYPELSAAALLEAARGYLELKNREQAERVLQRVLRDHPGTEWAKVAQERLDALRKG
jgi:TolA-binding protein